MSSMVRNALLAALAVSTAFYAAPALGQAGRASLVANQSAMGYAVSRWEQLQASQYYTFEDYATFLLAYPGFPDEDKLKAYAEARLAEEYVDPNRVLTYFAAQPPVTNLGRAAQALALMQLRPGEAETAARAAWRGGQMSPTAAATIQATFGSRFTAEDNDARMDALLWQRDAVGAAQQLPWVSPARSAVFAARLAILQGGDGGTTDPAARADPGYLYNRSRELRLEGRQSEAITLLATRPPLTGKPQDPAKWIEEHLNVARLAGSGSAAQIAARASEAFASESEVANGSYDLRDDYTSLMWLGGQRAFSSLRDGSAAAPLFYRYGAAARTPQTKSKGFYWAGEAASYAGDAAGARRYYEMAAAYPEYFYGQLALERLGRPIPALAAASAVQPTAEQRAAFSASPLAQAVVALTSSGSSWQTKRKFYVQLANQAQTEADLLLVSQLASDLGLPELAVVVGRVAPEKGFASFTPVGFPIVPTPAGANWTMVHAIARQESEFDDYRVSHAGAAGLMQLMPGTAREQAGKIGIAYMSANLMSDSQYNLRLGNSYFQRMYNSYGSYPLAVAAYNAGPGNVNKWLRQNGDPRNGGIRWIDWIEAIPIFETRNYVQRVLENAVVYEQLHPELSPVGRSRGISEFLR